MKKNKGNDNTGYVKLQCSSPPPSTPLFQPPCSPRSIPVPDCLEAWVTGSTIALFRMEVPAVLARATQGARLRFFCSSCRCVSVRQVFWCLCQYLCTAVYKYQVCLICCVQACFECFERQARCGLTAWATNERSRLCL